VFFVTHVYAGTTVRAELDENSVVFGDHTVIRLTVSGSLTVKDIQVPNIKGLDITSTGRSSSIQIINGQSTISAIYVFSVEASSKGVYRIPPFIVKTGSGVVKSNELTLSVGNSVATNPPGTNQLADNNEPQRFWIQTWVSDPEPYVSEQVLFHFRLYTIENIQSADFQLPNFDDYISEIVVKDKQGTQVVNGVNYATLDRVIALFPLKAGKMRIGETVFKFQYRARSKKNQPRNNFFNNSFFNSSYVMKTKTLRAKEIPLNIKTLPTPIPQDFTHLVGEFGIQASLSDEEIKMGDPVTLEIAYSGVGNIKDGVLPKLHLDNVKVYEDKPTLETFSSYQGISGKKSFKLALVPTGTGEISIPALSLSYFDPKKGDYVKFQIDPTSITVLPGDQESINLAHANNDGQEMTKVDYKGLAPLFANASDALSFSVLSFNKSFLRIVFFGLPSLFVFIILWRRFKPKQRDPRMDVKGLNKSLMKLLESKNVDDKTLLDAIRSFLEAKYKTQGKALTAIEMEELCVKNRVPSDVAKKLRELIEGLEARQYGFEKNNIAPIVKELKFVIGKL